MTTRLTIQLLFIGFLLGYKSYRIDNKIADTETEPRWILYWLFLWLLFPIPFIIAFFLDALNKKD